MNKPKTMQSPGRLTRLCLLLALLVGFGRLTHPAAAQSRVTIVTAGQSNAVFRLDDGGLMRASGWDYPLPNRQNPMIQQTLGLTQVEDIGNKWDAGRLTAVGGCSLMKSTGNAHFVDDLSSSNPQDWVLSDAGLQMIAQINQYANKQDIKFISWIQGEADAHFLDDPHGVPGSYSQGGPYHYDTREEWGNHYKDVLKAFLRLVRQATGLPNLRMAIQPIAIYDGGTTNNIRQGQIDAVDESNGDIIFGNSNPWQYYEPLSSTDSGHYSGRTYMDLALETGRSVAYALAQAGVRGTASGPGYGQFPRITGVTASGSSVDVSVSNPNGATTLVLPSNDPTQGWGVYANGTWVSVTGISLAAPFTIRLQLGQSVSGPVGVIYGSQESHSNRGGAITDNAATAGPADPVSVDRRNMPLLIKPTPRVMGPATTTPTTPTNPQPVTLRAADTPSGTVAGLNYQYYELTGLSQLPNFATLTPAATGTVATFDIAPRRRNDDFAFRYTGYVRVPQDGQYTFYTSSDDGSQLFIGSQLVVNNDGLHGTQERSGTIGLRAGLHAVTVAFFERGGNQVLNVSYQGPGVSKQTIPASALVSVPNSGPNPPSSGIVSGGVYRLVARHSGKALDVPGNAGGDEVPVQQYTVNNTSAQAWVVTLGADGYYTLTHQGTNQVLDLYANDESDGAAVQQYRATGVDAQKWRLVPAGEPGYYKVLHKDSNKGLDVNNAGQGDGERVQLWEYVGGPNYNQQWQFQRLDQASSRAATPANSAASSAGLAESAPLSAYPNPAAAGQRPTLRFAAEQAQTVTLLVRNQQGELVSLLTVPAQAGRTDFALPSALPAGTYFVQATVDGKKQRFTLKVE